MRFRNLKLFNSAMRHSADLKHCHLECLRMPKLVQIMMAITLTHLHFPDRLIPLLHYRNSDKHETDPATETQWLCKIGGTCRQGILRSSLDRTTPRTHSYLTSTCPIGSSCCSNIAIPTTTRQTRH